MTERLRQVLERLERFAEQLEPPEQDSIADLLQQKLEELADEQRWEELFNDPRSEALLDRLGTEAHKEHVAGRTEEITGDTFV